MNNNSPEGQPQMWRFQELLHRDPMIIDFYAALGETEIELSYLRESHVVANTHHHEEKMRLEAEIENRTGELFEKYQEVNGDEHGFNLGRAVLDAELRAEHDMLDLEDRTAAIIELQQAKEAYRSYLFGAQSPE